MANFMNMEQYGKEMYRREQKIRYMIPSLNYVVVDASSKLKDSDIAIRNLKKGISRSLTSIYDRFFPFTERPFVVWGNDITDLEIERRMDLEYKRISDIKARFKSVIDSLFFNLDQFIDKKNKDDQEASEWAVNTLKGSLNAYFAPDAL